MASRKGPPSGASEMDIEAKDRAAAHALFPLSAEVEARLVIYADLLRKWQKTINLVAPSTVPQLWMRHFADSLQVQAAAPGARRWADLGSGAGFPGLVTAICLADLPGAEVHLIESDQRKCAFLQNVSRETSAPAIVHHGRIETIVPTLTAIEAVSARALAPLPQLLDYAKPLLEKGALGLFLKGERVADELTEAEALGTLDAYDFSVSRSATSPSAGLVMVKAKSSRL
jgi:16S rRNA (guanine527-N7)-methyltransferase